MPSDSFRSANDTTNDNITSRDFIIPSAYAQVSILEGTTNSTISPTTTNSSMDVGTLLDETRKTLGENSNMLKASNLVVISCADKAGDGDWDVLKTCLAYEQIKNKYFKAFIKESQNLSNTILFGG